MGTSEALESIGQPGTATTTKPLPLVENKGVTQQTVGG
jgi:hypothetical protein